MNETNDTLQMQIKKYWQIILRRKYLFITCSLIVLSFIVWGSFFLPKIYRSESTVFIEKSLINNLVQGITGGSYMGDNRVRGLKYAILSRNVLFEVIKELDLDTVANDEAAVASMIQNFKENTEITEQHDEDLFIVSYQGEKPGFVRDYVNTLIAKYIETIRSSKRQEAYGASKFLSEQIDYYKKKIEAVEEKMAAFRRKEGIYLVNNEEALVNSIRENTEEIESVEMEIKKLEAKKKKVEQQLSGETPFTLAMIENEGGHTLPGRLRMLKQRLSNLLVNFTENYPEVIKVKAEIKTIEKALKNGTQVKNSLEGINSDSSVGMSVMNPIYQQLKEEGLNIESEIDSLRAKKETLYDRVNKAGTELKNIPKKKKILANLERDKNTFQVLYEQLLAKLGQAEVTEQVEIQDKGETFKVIEKAGLPLMPISPNRLMLIFMGIFAGAGAGFGIVLLKETSDTSVRDVDMLKSHFGMKTLAVIPAIVTKRDIEKKQKMDRKVYAFSIFYLLIIGGIFVKELISRFFLVG